ncbi:sensor histidine kinase [Halovivax cerinus]|uniref:histidine kinase n=1 Tax=Halovivax cerinus TaxID=1487865 RepID=A0ABD5NJB6_9EURY|nr:PAS domain-containing sensor histidine kinase [Halovivax cerinus]
MRRRSGEDPVSDRDGGDHRPIRVCVYGVGSVDGEEFAAALARKRDRFLVDVVDRPDRKRTVESADCGLLVADGADDAVDAESLEMAAAAFRTDPPRATTSAAASERTPPNDELTARSESTAVAPGDPSAVPVVLVGHGIRSDLAVRAYESGIDDVHRLANRDGVADGHPPTESPDGGRETLSTVATELAHEIERLVSERRRTAALCEERDRLETIVDRFPGVVYRCLAVPDWPMEYVTGAVEALTGYTAADLERNRYSWGRDVVHPADRERVADLVFDGLESAGSFELTYRIQPRDGTTKWVWERGTRVEPTPDGTPRIEGYVADVTDRRERAEQLQVISHLLRHNVRNDMTVVRGYTSLLAEETDEFDDETTVMLDRIDDLLTTVDKTQPIVDVLTTPHERGTVAVDEAIERAVETVETRHEVAPSRVSVVSKRVRAIPELERAFVEVVENAVVHSDGDEPEIEIRAATDDETVAVSVVDDGPVIPDMERDILTGDRTPEPLFHGTGLGLWLVEWIVRRSGGSLSFDETDEGGNVVTLTLPRLE